MNFFRRAGFRQAALFFGGITLGFFVLAMTVAGELYDFQDSFDGVHLPRVDAIVCLAGGRGRLSAAGDLWQRYHEQRMDPVLYLSGVGPQSTWKSVIHHFHRGVLESLKSDQVVLETESQNTEGNARYFAQIAKKKGWKRVVLMTSPYHLRRAKLIFDATLRDEDVSLQVETFSVRQDPFDAEEWRSSFHGIRVTLSEYFKWVYYSKFWKIAG